MNTKQLIEELQKQDPEGTMEVMVGTATPLWHVYTLPYYYDGRALRLVTDEHGRPEAFKQMGGGTKICLREFSPREAFWDYPDIPVLDPSGNPIAEYEAVREKVKQQCAEIDAEFEARRRP